MGDLISKIEAGDTSRETADEVLLRFGWTLEEDGPLVDNPERWFVSPTGDEFLDGDQPNPLTSLDAAMALVPEGLEISLTNLYGVARAEVGLNDNVSGPFYGECEWCDRSVQAMFAAALTIAALKALEARDG